MLLLFLLVFFILSVGFAIGFSVAMTLRRGEHLPGDPAPDDADWWKRNDPPPFA